MTNQTTAMNKSLRDNAAFFKQDQQPSVAVLKIDLERPLIQGRPIMIGIDVAKGGKSSSPCLKSL